MNEEDFVLKREADWKRLHQLVDRAVVSVSKMRRDELYELATLYRSVSEDLAVVRTRSANYELQEFLNNLVARAYSVLYSRPRGKFSAGIRYAFEEGARVVRRRWAFVLASLICTCLGIAFGWGIMAQRPDMRGYLVPDEALFEAWRSGRHEPKTSSEAITMLGFYSSNNPSVAIRASAMAAGSFGIGTAFLLYTNGQLLGALAHDVNTVGQLPHLLTSIAPHGASELTGIVISGAAGFVLGWALISPGRRTRGEALREAGRDGLVLLMMSVIMMFIAAPFEAFFSFNPAVPPPLKVVVAGIVFALWLLYWGFVGGPSENPDRPEVTAGV